MGLAATAVLCIGTLVGLWLAERGAKQRVHREKMSGRLPRADYPPLRNP